MKEVEIITANLNVYNKDFVDKVIKKVCAYARVSTDNEEQLTSYSSQINYYTEKIKSNPIGNLFVFMLMRVLVEHQQKIELSFYE